MSPSTAPSSRDPLVPFEDRVFDAVAERTGADPATLRALVRRQQETARDRPGIDNLLYEWRKLLPYDPVVARTETAFHCVVLPETWAEFGDALGLDDAAFERLLAVHDRQARRAAEARGESTAVFDGATPMVLTRP
jgi:2-hydroxychromene-2-carboxylate isomerase